MAPAELFGFLGGSIGLSQMLPQILRIRRLGHGRGVSLTMWLLMFVSSSTWFGYGFRIGSPSQMFTNGASWLLIGTVIVTLMGKPAHWYLSPYVLMPAVAIAMFLVTMVMPEALVPALMIAVTFQRLPQVFKSIRHRAEADESALSFTSLMVSVVSLVCWEIWSFLMGSVLVAVTTTLSFLLVISIALVEWSGRRSLLARLAGDEAEPA